MIWKKTLLVAMLAIGSQAYGQFSVFGGPSLLRPFGAQKTFVGFHIGGEYSVDDQMTYFGRFSHYPGVRDTFSTIVPLQPLSAFAPYAETSYLSKTNYTVITGGARYYVGDGFESGLSAYGGTTLNLVFNTIKAEFEPFNESSYTLPDGFASKGNAFGFGVGVQGGVKYGILDFATVYFDLGIDYMLNYTASNTLAGNSRYLSQFLFNFNIGFRKDFGLDW